MHGQVSMQPLSLNRDRDRLQNYWSKSWHEPAQNFYFEILLLGKTIGYFLILSLEIFRFPILPCTVQWSTFTRYGSDWTISVCKKIAKKDRRSWLHDRRSLFKWRSGSGSRYKFNRANALVVGITETLAECLELEKADYLFEHRTRFDHKIYMNFAVFSKHSAFYGALWEIFNLRCRPKSKFSE